MKRTKTKDPLEGVKFLAEMMVAGHLMSELKKVKREHLLNPKKMTKEQQQMYHTQSYMIQEMLKAHKRGEDEKN